MYCNKQKLWTLEILTSNLNSLMLNFTRSSYSTFAEYYDQFMTNKFKDNRTSKIKYSIILILSFLYYQKTHYFLDLYYWLFNEFEDRQVYELFVETKSLALSLQNLNDIAYINLDLVYLDYNEVIYVTNKALDLDTTQVQLFLEHQEDFIKQEGQQCIALERNEETNISVCLGQVVREFLLKSQNQQDKKIKEVEKAKERISNLQGLPRRDTGLREMVTSHIDEDQLKQIQNEAKYEEIEQLKNQIRRQKQLQNDYKRSTISLMATLTVLDPLTNEIRQKYQEFQDQLDTYKNTLDESQQINFANRTQNMNKAGMSLKKGCVRNLNKTLLHLNPSLYKKMQQRIQETVPKKKIIKDKLKKLLIDNEQKDLFSDCQAIDAQNLKNILSNLFDKKPNFGELCLLLNFHNNKEEEGDDCINLDNSLRNLCDKIIQMMDQLSEDKDLIRTESLLIRNWDTAQKKLDQINKKQDENLENLKKNSSIFAKKKHPSKLNQLLANQEENIIEEEEQIVNPKKKTLASTFEFIEQADKNENLQSTQNDPPQEDRKSITDMNEECFDEQNSMRENSDIEDENINTTDLEKTELVQTKNLIEQEPPLNQSQSQAQSVQQTDNNKDEQSEIDNGIEKSEFATMGFKQTFGGTDVQLEYKEQDDGSKIEIEIQNEKVQDEDSKHEMIDDEDEEDDKNSHSSKQSDKKSQSSKSSDKKSQSSKSSKKKSKSSKNSEIMDENEKLSNQDEDESNLEEDKSNLNDDRSNLDEDKSNMNNENEEVSDLNEENSDLNEERSVTDMNDEMQRTEMMKTEFDDNQQINQSEQRIRQVESFYEKRKTELLDENHENIQSYEEDDDEQNEQLQQNMQDNIIQSMKDKEEEHPDEFLGRQSYNLSNIVQQNEIDDEFENRQVHANSKSFKKIKQF